MCCSHIISVQPMINVDSQWYTWHMLTWYTIITTTKQYEVFQVSRYIQLWLWFSIYAVWLLHSNVLYHVHVLHHFVKLTGFPKISKSHVNDIGMAWVIVPGCGSVAEHWWHRPEVSWVWLLITSFTPLLNGLLYCTWKYTHSIFLSLNEYINSPFRWLWSACCLTTWISGEPHKHDRGFRGVLQV